MSWGDDWRTLMVPARIFVELETLARRWQMSRENALSLLLRAVTGNVPWEGDISLDLAQFERWARQVIAADPVVTPHLPTRRVTLRDLGIDAEGNPKEED